MSKPARCFSNSPISCDTVLLVAKVTRPGSARALATSPGGRGRRGPDARTSSTEPVDAIIGAKSVSG